MRPLEAKHLRGGFRRSPWPLDGDKDRACDCPKLDEADLGRLERPVKAFSVPAAVSQPALANYTSHHKHTQPEGRGSPAASPLEGGKHRGDGTAANTTDTNTTTKSAISVSPVSV